MRARLIALGVLAIVLGFATVALAYSAAAAQFAGQAIATGTLTTEQAAREQLLFSEAFALQAVTPPVAAAALLAVIAIVAVLARRSQLRRRALAR